MAMVQDKSLRSGVQYDRMILHSTGSVLFDACRGLNLLIFSMICNHIKGSSPRHAVLCRLSPTGL